MRIPFFIKLKYESTQKDNQMNYKPFTPTILDQAVNELLDKVYQAELDGRVVRTTAFKEIEDKYQVLFKVLYDRLKSNNLIITDNNSSFIQITDKGRRIQQQGGYIDLLERLDQKEQQDEYDKSLGILDKESAIADRKKTRRLSWIAIIISLIALGYPIFRDLQSEKAESNNRIEQNFKGSKRQNSK